mmetsp:Transcript_15829/g.49214  ORF Transcript_15829/g.49214 Transcript_15829/m.49214 type:complete len:225 (-) Transcript_15829:27-701(-)
MFFWISGPSAPRSSSWTCTGTCSPRPAAEWRNRRADRRPADWWVRRPCAGTAVFVGRAHAGAGARRAHADTAFFAQRARTDGGISVGSALATAGVRWAYTGTAVFVGRARIDARVSVGRAFANAGVRRAHTGTAVFAGRAYAHASVRQPHAGAAVPVGRSNAGAQRAGAGTAAPGGQPAAFALKLVLGLPEKAVGGPWQRQCSVSHRGEYERPARGSFCTPAHS